MLKLKIKQPKLEPEFNKLYNQWGFRLLDDYTFTAAGGGVHTIPWGFWYNAGSIPAMFWQLTYCPYHPVLLAPTLVHDWAYCSHVIPRDVADQTLHDYGLYLSASVAKMATIKAAVATFGNMYYKRDRVDNHYLAVLKTHIKNTGRNLTPYGLSD